MSPVGACRHKIVRRTGTASQVVHRTPRVPTETLVYRVAKAFPEATLGGLPRGDARELLGLQAPILAGPVAAGRDLNGPGHGSEDLSSKLPAVGVPRREVAGVYEYVCMYVSYMYVCACAGGIGGVSAFAAIHIPSY